MFFLRSFPSRILVTIALLCLLSLSLLLIKNGITVAWQNEQQETALYERSPNCFPRTDPTQIDTSLPPCQNVTMMVTAKPENTVIDHRRSGDYPRTHRFLTLQEANGPSQTVGDIYEDMWNSIRIGDQVSATLWRNQVRKVDANGYSISIFDESRWNKTEASLWPWAAVSLLCTALIIFIWKYGSQRISSTFP